MKTAIYIDDTGTQLVLTPETDWEKQAVKSIEEGTQSIRVMRGSFYETRGGWIRNGADDTSLILRTCEQSEPVPTP